MAIGYVEAALVLPTVAAQAVVLSVRHAALSAPPATATSKVPELRVRHAVRSVVHVLHVLCGQRDIHHGLRHERGLPRMLVHHRRRVDHRGGPAVRLRLL